MSDQLTWGTALLAFAVVLVAVEIFMPSMGLIALVASLCAIGGIVAFWMEGTAWGVSALLFTLVGGAFAIIFAFKIMPYTPMGRGLILTDEAEGDDDVAAEKLREEAERRELERALIGAEGVAKTDLHPVGSVTIDGSTIEVLAIGGAVESGERVRVAAIEGNVVKVRRVT